MRVTVNGTERQLQDGITLAELVRLERLTPERVAIEVNEQLVSRRAYDQTRLREGDRVEIVTFVGGG